MISFSQPPPEFTAASDPNVAPRIASPSDAGEPAGVATREDLRALVLQLWQPLLKLSSPSNAHCVPGATGVIYDDAAAGLEGFCRPLWGVLACAAGSDWLPGTEGVASAVAAGVDPAHDDYWGEFQDGDQRCVEMAVLGWSLAAAPQVIWQQLDAGDRENLVRWLEQINRVRSLPANNWRFFRILVNLGLQSVGEPWSGERLEEDLALIEKCYLGNGWYSDGEGSQRDYYVAMAMHFYGLLIAAQSPPGLEAHTARYRERARLFAGHFIHWFARNGEAVPFGRSLIYRFAQGAFWSALAWANEEALPWGVLRGVLFRHLRSWLADPILDHSGVLTIGYRYPNLNIAESYNSPSSPYWAMKALLVAGLPEEHPFWLAREEALPELAETVVQEEPGFIIRRHDDAGDVTVLASGQYPSGWHLRHAGAKYGKFAYSTRFGFSVPVGPVTLEDGAFDNMLALSDDGHHWRVRERCLEARIENGMLRSWWEVWPDVRIQTWLFFEGHWQVRVHHLETMRPLRSAEAGHAVQRSPGPSANEAGYYEAGRGFAAAVLPSHAAGLFDPSEDRKGVVIVPAPNSNLIHARTILPTLSGEHAPGSHWLVTLVPVTSCPQRFEEQLRPEVEMGSTASHLQLALPLGRRLSFSLDGKVAEEPEPLAGSARIAA